MPESVERNGLRLDVDTGVLRHDRVLVQRTPLATLVMGFGTKAVQLRRFACGDADVSDPFIARCLEIDAAIEMGRLAKTRQYRLPRSAYTLKDRLLRRLVIAEALAKAGFNSDEPRDERGRWTKGGDTPLQEGRSVAVTTVAASAAEDFATTLEGWAGWAFGGSVGREALAALGRFAAGAVVGSIGALAGAITALGVLVIPTNRDSTSRGTLPDRPDIDYQFDAPAGVLTLSRDGEVFYSGRLVGGSFRDNRGRIFGRLLDGNIVVDPDILPPPFAFRAPGSAGSDAHGRPIAETDSTTEQPKLCPDPTPEPDWEDRSERALQYQEQITGLERGVDVEFRGVRFDGCRESDGTMLEAKGKGFAWAMTQPVETPEGYTMDFFEGYTGAARIMKQAGRQSQAAAFDRRIEWYFAEEPVANYFRKQFKIAKYANIKVFHEPYVRRTEKWADWIQKYLLIGAIVPKAPPLAPSA